MRQLRNWNYRTIIGISIVIFIVLLQINFFSPVRDRLRRVIVYPATVFDRISLKLSTTTRLIFSINDLAKENDQLRLQNSIIEAELGRLLRDDPLLRRAPPAAARAEERARQAEDSESARRLRERAGVHSKPRAHMPALSYLAEARLARDRHSMFGGFVRRRRSALRFHEKYWLRRAADPCLLTRQNLKSIDGGCGILLSPVQVKFTMFSRAFSKIGRSAGAARSPDEHESRLWLEAAGGRMPPIPRSNSRP